MGAAGHAAGRPRALLSRVLPPGYHGERQGIYALYEQLFDPGEQAEQAAPVGVLAKACVHNMHTSSDNVAAAEHVREVLGEAGWVVLYEGS